MPAVAAHYYFGQEVLKRLPKTLQTSIMKNKDAFDLGLQGPDLLFFYKPYLLHNHIRKLGNEMHFATARATITPAIEQIRKTANERSLTYLLGFTCHFALDSSLHGRIRGFVTSLNDHFLLESEMERQVIQGHFTPVATTFRRYQLVRSNNKDTSYLQAVYPSLTTQELHACTRSTNFFNRVLYSPHGCKRLGIRILEKVLGMRTRFSSLMVLDQARKGFEGEARTLVGMLEDSIPTGVTLTQTVYQCLLGHGNLTERFDQNFE